jgi:hypothetical protein
MTYTFAQFLWAIGQQESGGNYADVNSSSGALGKYQVMPSNLSNWLAAAGLPQMTAQQFLNNPSAQEQVATSQLKPAFDKYGPEGAAAIWYSGQPDPTKTYGNPPVFQYVKEVMDRLPGAPATGSQQNGSNSGVQQASITSDVGGAVADGILKGFAGALGPVLKWALWFAETALGFAVMIGGAILIMQSSEAVRDAEKTSISMLPSGRMAKAAGFPKAKMSTAPKNPVREKNPYSGKPVKSADAERAKRVAAAERAAGARAERARVKAAEKAMKEGRENA